MHLTNRRLLLFVCFSFLIFCSTTLSAQTPSPSVSVATFSPTGPGPAATPNPEPVRSAPIWAQPPLNPARELPPLARPRRIQFVGRAKADLGYMERATPRITVWRSGSNAPQIATRSSKRRFQAKVAGSEPVTILLRFHPLVAGKLLSVKTTDGVFLQPNSRQVQIGGTGEGVLVVTIEAAKEEGVIGLELDGIETVLHLNRAPERFVAQREAASQEGAR